MRTFTLRLKAIGGPGVKERHALTFIVKGSLLSAVCHQVVKL